MEFQEGTESGLDGSGFTGGGGAQTWEIKLTFIDCLLSAKSFCICSRFEEESFVPPRFPVLGWLQEGSRLWRFLNYSLTLGGLGRSLGVSDQIHILGKLINRGCGAQFPPPPHGGARRHPSHPQGGGPPPPPGCWPLGGPWEIASQHLHTMAVRGGLTGGGALRPPILGTLLSSL